jgi:glycerol uptake facilitator-like aquaporin
LLLAATVIGSGIMAERLSGGNLAVALLANTAATVAVLATLIALLGAVSGAHFNPAVSVIEALRGRLPRSLTNTFSGIRSADVPAFIGAQFVGAFAALAVAWALFRSEKPTRAGSDINRPRDSHSGLRKQVSIDRRGMFVVPQRASSTA